MRTLRSVLAIMAGCAFGCGFGFLILGLGYRDAGIAVAVGVGFLVLLDVARFVQRGRDKQRHPASAPPWCSVPVAGVDYRRQR